MLALIAGSAGFQVYAHAHLRMPMAKWLTPYCASDLAWGALAGLIELRTRPRRFAGHGAGPGGVRPCWSSPGASTRGDSPSRRAWQLDLAPTAYGIGGACLVFGLWRTTNPLLVWPLSLAPIAYLGRISYGLYAFHLPVLRGYWQVEVPYAFYIPQIYRELILTIAPGRAVLAVLRGADQPAQGPLRPAPP